MSDLPTFAPTCLPLTISMMAQSQHLAFLRLSSTLLSRVVVSADVKVRESADQDVAKEGNARITDVDAATDVATLVRKQIIQQAVTAMLAQANQQPALVLALLR